MEDLSLENSFSFLPNCLRLLLTKLIVGADNDGIKMKVSAIGQALIHAVRTRAVLAPLQIGFGVQMHHHFRSKYLIESLHALGFSSS